MKVRNVWVLTSEYEPEVYSSEEEALDATLEEIVNNDICAVERWLESLTIDEKRSLVEKIQRYSDTIMLTKII